MPSALVWVVGLRLKWPEHENPPALPLKTQQLSGARPVSLLWAGPEQQMLGMNISGILSSPCNY